MANDMKQEATYLPELMAEKDSIDPSFVHAVRLISEEIEKIRNPPPPTSARSPSHGSQDFFNIYDHKFPKIECNIKVPTELYPKINFVGRLIGPGGSTLKGIQEVTHTRIAILGKGSVRDRKKQEEIASGNEDKLAHLKLPLHVKITSIAQVDKAYLNVGRAASEITKLLQVDEEEEAMMMGQDPAAQFGRYPTRGGSSNRGSSRGRGAGRGQQNSGMRGSGRGSRGGGGARGMSRGQPSSRLPRGGSRGGSSARSQKSQMLQVQDPYMQAAEEYGYDYTEGGYDGFGEYEGAYDQTYAEAEYTAPYGEDHYASEGYDYSYGEGYDSYGNGAADQGYGAQTGTQQSGPSKPFRGKLRGSGRGRPSKPY